MIGTLLRIIGYTCFRAIPDWVAHKIAWFLPRRIVYWAFIRVCAHATTGEYSRQVVPELPAMEALQRWQQ